MEEKVLIGRWSTSTRKTQDFLYAPPRCGAKYLKELLEGRRRFSSAVDSFEVRGMDLVIHTPKKGAWIGTKGWRIKGLQRCCNPGRVILEETFTINTGGSYFCRVRIPQLNMVVTPHWAEIGEQGEIRSLWYAKLFQWIREQLAFCCIGEEARGAGDQQTGIESYFFEPAMKRLEEIGPEIMKRYEKIRDAEDRRYQRDKELATIEEENKEYCYIVKEKFTDVDHQWIELAIKVARKGQAIGKRLGIYPDHIYIGGSCGYDSKADEKMLEQWRQVISDLPVKIVPHPSQRGQWFIVPDKKI